MTGSASHDDFIRPFVITGGRTEVHRRDLQLDTLLSAVSAPRPQQLGFEHRAVVSLCKHPVSIAEIAGTLHLPVGVITVIVDDLLGAEQVTVHNKPTNGVTVAVLERILDGVRAL